MLGYTFGDLNLSNLTISQYYEIREKVSEHGVICIKNQNLKIDELIAITKRFGEPVLIPEELRFNNTYKEYPELARVSNIRTDGTLIESHHAAEYWHSDGDFWPPGRNYLFNLLYGVTIPIEGGRTGFADLRMAYQSLSSTLQIELEGLQVIVSCDDIPDFRNVSESQKQPDAYHYIKHQHVETKKLGLYFGHTLATIHNIPKQESDRVIEALVNAIEVPENQYIHCWEKGDLLIWDNTSVMHKSMGGYANNPRLLYRTQAFINPANE